MAFNVSPPKLDRGTPDEFAALNSFLASLVNHLNGGVSLTKNAATKVIEVEFRGVAQDQPIDHGLGRIPEGFMVVGSTTPGAVITESTKEKTASRMYLQSDTAFAKVKLMFF